LQVIADYWSYFRFPQKAPLFNILVWGEPPKFTTTKFGLEKVETPLNRIVETYCDILNRLGVDRECDRQTDRQNRQPFSKHDL